MYNIQDLYMYEILDDYKKAENIEEKDEIFNAFCNLIWNSSNIRRVYKKDITFKIRQDLLEDEIGLIFNKWTNVTYMSYKRSSKETDFVSLIRQKVNNIYTNMFDNRVILNKEYMDLIKTPKNLYYQWKNGCIFTENELTQLIDNAINESIIVKEKYSKQKMKLSWNDYKNEVEKSFRKCFDNYKSLDEYEDSGFITLYVDTWCEDNFYIKYFCKSLNGYFRNFQKEYYDLYIPSSRLKSYKLQRCDKCGNLYKQEYHNQKLCKQCSTYQPIETKTVICQDCEKVFEVNSKDTKTNRCKECYIIYRNNILNKNSKEYYYYKQILDIKRMSEISELNKKYIIEEVCNIYNITYNLAEELYNKIIFAQTIIEIKQSCNEIIPNFNNKIKDVINSFKKFYTDQF